MTEAEEVQEQTCWTAGLHAPGLVNPEARHRLFELLSDHQDIISSELDAELGYEQDLIMVGMPCADVHTAEEASEIGMLQRKVAELKGQLETLGEIAAQAAQERDDVMVDAKASAHELSRAYGQLSRISRIHGPVTVDSATFCNHCRDSSGRPLSVPYPCPTQRARDVGEGKEDASLADELDRAYAAVRERDNMAAKALEVELAWRDNQRRYPRPQRYTLALVDEAFIAEVGLGEMVLRVGQRLESELRHFVPNAQIVYQVCAPDELGEDMLTGHRPYAPGTRAVVAYAFSPAFAEGGGDA